MHFEPSEAERGAEQDLERLGTRHPKCAQCPEDDPRALTGTFPDILCAEHRAIAQGRAPIEGQHPPGRHNDPDTTVDTYLNDHTIWDESKLDWPERTRLNPDGSPLIAAAASVRTVLDWFRQIIQRVLGWVPEFLEALDARLTEVFGGPWWGELGFEGV